MYSAVKIELDDSNYYAPRIFAKYGSDYFRVQEVRFLDDPEETSWLQIQFPATGTTIQISDPKSSAQARTYAKLVQSRIEEKKTKKPVIRKRSKNGHKSEVKSLQR